MCIARRGSMDGGSLRFRPAWNWHRRESAIVTLDWAAGNGARNHIAVNARATRIVPESVTDTSHHRAVEVAKRSADPFWRSGVLLLIG